MTNHQQQIDDDGDYVNTLILREDGAAYLRVPMPLMIFDCISWARQFAGWHERHARRKGSGPLDLNVLSSWRITDELRAWAKKGGIGSINHPFLTERLKLGPPVINKANVALYAAALMTCCEPITPAAPATPATPLDVLWLIDDAISSLVTTSHVLHEHCGLYVQGHLVEVGEVDRFAQGFWARVAGYVDEIASDEK